MKYIVSHGEDVQTFEDRKEAVQTARELSESSRVTLEWQTRTSHETLHYANGELQSADSQNLSRR